ncbi:MAG: hypothetical protein IPF79_05810 [Ignavibacteria bacterium]|nr:hypothetical protein [Ignavibacteria bacterium]
MTVRAIHEYGSLGIERDDRDVRLTRQQASLLEEISDTFKRDQKDRLIDWYRSDEMRWRQYVGVVQIGDLTLEILPKIARHAVNDDADRAYLLRMLAESGMLPIAMDELANFTTQKWTLLDLVIYSFALEVKKQLHRGRIQRYELVEEERSTIRGKLLVGKHARRDPIRQLRFPCRFSQFTPNTPINRLLRTAACKGLKLTQHAAVRQALAWVEHQLDDVDCLVRPYVNSLPSIVYDRTTVRYQRSCTLAEQILRGLAPHVHAGRTEYAALLFDMNELFERWVAARMQRTYARQGTSVHVQGPHRYLYTNPTGGAFTMKPDIVIGLSNGPDPIVVDTKWKLLDASSTYAGVAQADAYQMYAYMDRYHASRVILLYPHHPGYDRPVGKQAEYRHPTHVHRTLEVWTVDVEDVGKTGWML